jgi:hypothetical protein
MIRIPAGSRIDNITLENIAGTDFIRLAVRMTQTTGGQIMRQAVQINSNTLNAYSLRIRYEEDEMERTYHQRQTLEITRLQQQRDSQQRLQALSQQMTHTHVTAPLQDTPRDGTAMLQDAISAAEERGGMVRLGPGHYTASDTIAITPATTLAWERQEYRDIGRHYFADMAMASSNPIRRDLEALDRRIKAGSSRDGDSREFWGGDTWNLPPEGISFSFDMTNETPNQHRLQVRRNRGEFRWED